MGGVTQQVLMPVEWAEKMTAFGAGEILLTSMDRDGTKNGFDLNSLRITDAVSVPVIASGGVGNLQHLVDGVVSGGADAVLSRQHFSLWRIYYSRGQTGYMADRGCCSSTLSDKTLLYSKS